MTSTASFSSRCINSNAMLKKVEKFSIAKKNERDKITCTENFPANPYLYKRNDQSSGQVVVRDRRQQVFHYLRLRGSRESGRGLREIRKHPRWWEEPRWWLREGYVYPIRRLLAEGGWRNGGIYRRQVIVRRKLILNHSGRGIQVLLEVLIVGSGVHGWCAVRNALNRLLETRLYRVQRNNIGGYWRRLLLLLLL